MVKNRRKIRFIKTNVCVHSFERLIDPSGEYFLLNVLTTQTVIFS